MERVRHGPDISTDTTTDPNQVDDITTSNLEPQVKRLFPMDPTQIPTSTQYPINNPSTSHAEPLEDIGILRDTDYQVLDLGEMINLQSLQEDENHVQYTPNMDQHVNEEPHQEALGFIAHLHLPYLDFLVQEKGLLDISMWMKFVYQDLKVSFPNALSIGNVAN